jgi:ABC-2 type transport system ATP-binding protein
MLEVRQVGKRFGKVTALQDVSLEVSSGEIGAVVGPNGAGKSTLLGIVAGVLPPDAGQVRVDGMDTFARAPQVRRHLTFLPESCPLYRDLRVVEHLTYRGKLKGLSRKRLRARVRSVIESCGLEDLQHQLIGRLSLGQRQRVGLADVMLTEPRLMVLDEPFAGLDAEQAGRFCDLLAGCARHSAILLATHRLDLVARLCRRCTALQRGRVVGSLAVGPDDAPLAERLQALWRAGPVEVEPGGIA